MRGPTTTYALTVGKSVERRVEARGAPVGVAPSPGLAGDEVLVLLPVERDDASRGLQALERHRRSVHRAALALLPVTTSLLEAPDASGAVESPHPLPVRALVAAVVRRLRRRALGDAELEIDTALPRDGRATHVDATSIAELVLSGWEALTSLAGAGRGRLSITEAGCRLRFALDASDVERARVPDLRTQAALRRSLRPVLRRLGATFETVRSGDTRRIVVTIPTWPESRRRPELHDPA